MDFGVSEAMSVRLAMIAEFMDREVIPLEGEMLHGDPETLAAGVAAAQAKVKQMGLWAPNHPVEFGGLGLSMVDHGLFAEAVGRSPLGMTVFGTQAPDAGNIEILHRYGTPEQQDRWLRPLVDGEIRSCFSMTEPETAGSNPVLLATTATVEGDDYVINGQKWFTSSADGAAFAIVMAVTNPDAPPHQRSSMIIVPTDTPGFNLVRNVSVMGHVGSGHASHGEVIYQSCRVPRSNLLGPEGGGFVIAQDRLGPGRIHHCMRWLGIAARAFEMMCERANERIIDRDGNHLADRQVIQHWAAELDAEIRGARLQVLHAAWMIDQHGAKAARDEISAIKFVVANTMLKAVDSAIQVHGALGVTDDTVLAYWYRHERAARIYDGADEVHKTSLGRRLLRRFGPSAPGAGSERPTGGSASATGERSVYETLGGEALIGTAVEAFYSKLRSDPIVGEFFTGADLSALETHQKMFLTAALGGPDAYEGRDMRAAHAHLKIADVDFDLFIQHLEDTLSELDVEPERIADVLDSLAPLRREIVAAPSDTPDEWANVDPAGGRG